MTEGQNIMIVGERLNMHKVKTGRKMYEEVSVSNQFYLHFLRSFFSLFFSPLSIFFDFTKGALLIIVSLDQDIFLGKNGHKKRYDRIPKLKIF